MVLLEVLFFCIHNKGYHHLSCISRIKGGDVTIIIELGQTIKSLNSSMFLGV